MKKKLKFAIVTNEITANSQDLVSEIKKRGCGVEYLNIDYCQIDEKGNNFFLVNQNNQEANLNDFDIFLWRGANIDTSIRQSFANWIIGHKKIFIENVWAQKNWTHLKYKQVELFSENKIPFPKTLFINNFDLEPGLIFSKLKNSLNLPFIVKPISGAKGKDIYLIKDQEGFGKLSKIIKNKKYIFQEHIPNDGDFRALVVNFKFIGAFKRIPKKGDFRSNISLGGTGKRILPDKQIIDIAIKTAKAIGIAILGVDIIQNNKTGKYYVLETNGIPQWQGFKKATDINVAEKIIDYCISLYRKITV